MKFTKLRLSGFKSFVDPVDLFIEPGLTGIVGPNGCGKSNLLEALRWVMGETRPTTMRGSGMDDVIFGGTGTRPMRNNAEVTLFIDNSDHTAPAPYNELDIVEISRRIEREAGSTYRINGREVRQRDVQIFFADAASGAASPALVRQGQIAIIINQKPLARRAILEEAAGITGLHQRRHEAELRLKAAETNMARLADIIVEIEGQLQGLKRQARQASRYRNLSGYILKAEALAFLLHWQAAETQREAAAETLSAASKVVAERTAIAAQASTGQTEAANELPPLREAEAALSAALQRLLHERNTLDSEETRARDDAQKLRQHISQAEQDRVRDQSLEQDALTALEELGGETQALEQAGASAASELSEAEASARELMDALAARESILERLTSQLADLNANRASHERAQSEAAESTLGAETQLEELAPRLTAALAEVAGAPDVDAAESAVEVAREKAAAARQGADAARERLNAATQAKSKAWDPLEPIEQKTQRLCAEVNALAKLLPPVGSDLWPPLIDSVHVEPGYEFALAAALGDDLDAPVDETAPHHWRNLGTLDAPPLPGGAVALSKFIKAPEALARRLAFTGVIAQELGATAQKELRAGQRLVTQRGDLWRWDGFSISAEATSPAAVRLEQRNQLEALTREANAAKKNRDYFHTIFTKAEEEAHAAREAAATAEQDLRESEAALVAAQDHAAKAARATGEYAAKLAMLESEERTLTNVRDGARRADTAARENLRALADGAALTAQLAEARVIATTARTCASDAQAAAETSRREAQSRARRAAAIADESARWTARREAAIKHIAALGERMETMRDELATLEAVPHEIGGRRNALLDAIGKAEAARGVAADVRAESEARLSEADKNARTAERALSEVREERAAAQARAEAASVRLDELKTRIQDELDTPPEELFERAELKPGAELPPIEYAESRVEKLKNEREQMGGVNLRAEEEANEYTERLQSLNADRTDLEGAVQRLRRGIQTLNREGRERLLASFEKVNANFERLFKELFQGGEARLTFTESDDPLEAGLEILARPPGKKLTTLSLLSGGEQALTAISLIFAVFLVNPAPICVLDEVDAALDDANVDRFCRLLDEMTRVSDTHYLIISHHALTMSRMDRLFGVTMTERGVSQLVSVSLSEAERVVAAE